MTNPHLLETYMRDRQAEVANGLRLDARLRLRREEKSAVKPVLEAARSLRVRAGRVLVDLGMRLAACSVECTVHCESATGRYQAKLAG